MTRNRCRNRYTPNNKKLSSLTRDCNLPIFRANETITNLTQYELFQEESDLLKAGLYFSIQPDKIRPDKIQSNLSNILIEVCNILCSQAGPKFI